MTGAERRHHARVDLARPLRGSVDLRTDVQALNLGPTGSMIVHAGRLCPGQVCSLILPLGGGPLRLRAHVVWSQVDGLRGGPGGRRELHYRSGLQFVELPEGDEARILEYLATFGGPRSRSLAAPHRPQGNTASPASTPPQVPG